MKKEIILSFVVDIEDIDDMQISEPTEKDLDEYLEQTMFDVCEEWVIRGNRPDLEIKVVNENEILNL